MGTTYRVSRPLLSATCCHVLPLSLTFSLLQRSRVTTDGQGSLLLLPLLPYHLSISSARLRAVAALACPRPGCVLATPGLPYLLCVLSNTQPRSVVLCPADGYTVGLLGRGPRQVQYAHACSAPFHCCPRMAPCLTLPLLQVCRAVQESRHCSTTAIPPNRELLQFRPKQKLALAVFAHSNGILPLIFTPMRCACALGKWSRGNFWPIHAPCHHYPAKPCPKPPETWCIRSQHARTMKQALLGLPKLCTVCVCPCRHVDMSNAQGATKCVKTGAYGVLLFMCPGTCRLGSGTSGAAAKDCRHAAPTRSLARGGCSHGLHQAGCRRPSALERLCLTTFSKDIGLHECEVLYRSARPRATVRLFH